MMGSITGENMAERFLAEAKKLLELERGWGTIPIVHALCLMYLTSALLGRDRAGSMYRYTADETLSLLLFEQNIKKLDENDLEKAQHRRVLSKSLWGLFVFKGYV